MRLYQMILHYKSLIIFLKWECFFQIYLFRKEFWYQNIFLLIIYNANSDFRQPYVHTRVYVYSEQLQLKFTCILVEMEKYDENVIFPHINQQ